MTTMEYVAFRRLQVDRMLAFEKVTVHEQKSLDSLAEKGIVVKKDGYWEIKEG